MSTAINTLAALIIARLLGPELYGLYTVVLVAPTIFVFLAGWGLNTSIIRNSAYHLSRNERDIAKRKTWNSILCSTFIGLLFTAISYVGSPFIATFILNRPTASNFVELVSLVILGQILLNCAVGAFIGWAASGYASATSIIQAALKAAISISLIILGFKVFGAIVGQVYSIIIAGGIGIVLFSFTKSSPGDVGGYFKFFLSDVKSAIRFGGAPEASANLSAFISSTYILIILTSISNNTVVGWFQAASNITIAITLLATAIGQALVPAFSSLEGSKGNTKLAFDYAVKYTAIFMAPVILFLAASAKSTVDILYGQAYLPSTPYLVLLAIGFLPIIIGLTTFSSFFNGVGRTNLTVIAALSSVPPIVLLAPIFGKIFGPFGLIYSVIISDVVTCVVALYLAAKYLSARIDYASCGKALLIGIICFAVVYYFFSELSVTPILLFVLEFGVFFFLYLTIMPFVRIIDSSDIDRLRIATRSLGFLSKIIDLVLNYEKYLVSSISNN